MSFVLAPRKNHPVGKRRGPFRQARNRQGNLLGHGSAQQAGAEADSDAKGDREEKGFHYFLNVPPESWYFFTFTKASGRSDFTR